ncbi:ROK family protein [Hyphomonas sp.]|uniref:ROK family protein n=1 Tax=Hyphomonas sp. TaxID=87 RepID=UPI003D2CC1CF
MNALLAGVEIGGTKCVCTLATCPDDIQAQIHVPTTSPERTLGNIATVLDQWRLKYGFLALGIASFGPLELDTKSPALGTLVRTPKVSWSGANLTSLAGHEPFAIQTDVNAAAIAEGRWGAARGLASWAYITVGTGVGVGSVVAGQPLTGLGHSEAGHLRIPGVDTIFGACPYHGDCVEGQASGPALEAGSGIPGPDIPPDHPVLERAAKALAYLCHNLVYTSLPQRILIGGGVILDRPILLTRIQEHLVRSLSDYGAGHEIAENMLDYLVMPQLGKQAGPMGSICLAAEALDRSVNPAC